MLTGWLWRTIKPKPLAVLTIAAVWVGALAVLWFLVYPALGPLTEPSPAISTGD